MLDTYILYLSMAILGPLLVKFIVGKKSTILIRQWIVLSIFLFILAVIIGGRYEVGSDFPNYVNYYKSYLQGFNNFNDIFGADSRLEPGYLFINWFCSKLGLSVSLFFTLMSFCSFLLLFNAQKNRAYLWPFILFFFFGQMFGTSMNIVRQSCAIFLFFYAVQFIGYSKFKLFLLITGCTMLHYSSVVMYLAMVIDWKFFKFIDNKKLVIIAFVVTWFFPSYILPFILKLIPIEMLNAKYLNSLDNIDIEMEVSSGLGIFATKITDCLLIGYSDKIKDFYKDEKLKYLYRLFFVGIIMSNLMGTSMFLSRLFLGMVLLRIYILALTAYYCFKYIKMQHKFFGIYLVVITLIMIIMSIKNNNSGISPYNFMWQ